MTQEVGPRKLAAIMSIDVVGFSAMTEIDESGAAAVVARLRSVLDTIVGGYGGRIFNTAGDGFMLEFASAAGALAAAELIWSGVERRHVRVGVHVGDVLLAQNGDLIGHSVNIAARLQQLAQPGTALCSVLDPRDKYVRLYVPVPDLAQFPVGRRVEIELDSRPGERIPGEVSFVADVASFTPEKIETRTDRVGQVYRAKIRILEHPERLAPGTEGDVYVTGEAPAS